MQTPWRTRWLPLPHKEVRHQRSYLPTEEALPRRFRRYKSSYYYDHRRQQVFALRRGTTRRKVEVFLPGGKDKKFIAVEQIRATSLEDVTGMLGNGVSFVTGSAYPLNHSVHWKDRRLPGARGMVWGGHAVDSAIVSVLDNGLMVVKVHIDSGNALYANYHLYLIHNKSRGVLHYGNHRHH